MALPSLITALGALTVPIAILWGDHPRGLHAAAASAAAFVALLAATVGGRARPWWLLCGGLAGYAIGSMVAAPAHQAALPSSPSSADVAWLCGAALVIAGIDRLTNPRSRDVDVTARLDIALAGGVVVAVGAVLAGPALIPAGVETDVRVAIAVGLLLAGALVAASVRLALTGAASSAPGLGLVLGAAVLGLATAAAQVDGPIGVDLRRPVLAGLAAGSMLLAAAALHPSVRRLSAAARRAPSALRRPRIVLLLVALGAAPVTAVTRHLLDEPVDGRVVAVASGALVLLALGRLELASRAERRQSARQVTVRDASAALAAADDGAEVRRIALRACREAAGTTATTVVWVDVTDRGPAVVRAIGPAGEQSPLETLTMQRIARLPDVPDGPARTPVGAGELALFPVPRRTGIRGMVIVEGGGPVPLDLDDALLTICAQAGLALDKVAARRHAPRGDDARFRQLLRHSPDAVLVLDRHLRIRYQSPSVLHVTGHPPAELDGGSIERIVWPTDAKHLVGFLDQVLRSPPESARITEVGMARADGSQVQAEVIGANLLDTPDVEGIVLTLRDITHRRALEDELRHQAFHDALTGLANRALFRDRVEHALNLAERSDGPPPAVAFLDLDDFKPVNDTLGHSVGDELLRVVAERIRSCLRSGDTPARLGGDEFAVLLEGAADDSAVHEVAERILHVLHEPMTVHGHELRVRASIGVAHRLDPDTTTDDLLRHADLAMYTAKSSGKGMVVTFDASMHDELFGRASIRGELERSIERAEIGIAYQPIVRLATGEVVAFEALARWAHPERGLVSPSEFLPLAEASGAIVGLGQHVLEHSCRQLALWRSCEGGARWAMHINLSLRQLLSASLVSMVEQAAGRAGVPVDGLVFEISETVLRSDDTQMAQRLQRLRSLGARIAIDDVGTGAVPLAAMHGVPFDLLKLDRRLVAALGDGEPELAAVRAAVDLVRRTGGDVIAEGVEDADEADRLLAMGCDLGQGFLFSAAADAALLADDLGLPRTA